MINSIKKVLRDWFRPGAPARRDSQFSNKVTDTDIEAARRVNLAAYIEKLGCTPRWQSGSTRAMFLSPLRDEKNPSFSVSLYKGYWNWKDWGTGESGDAIKFVELYQGLGFLDAVRSLNGEYGHLPALPSPVKRKSAPDKPETDKKAEWVQGLYRESLSLLNTRDIETMQNYFRSQGVKHHPEMGCVIYTSFKEKKRYLAVPIPFPSKMRGLECREIMEQPGEKLRKTLGHKTLWVMKRNPAKVLITESILDALAGEVIFSDQEITLCSINGVGNIELLKNFMDWLKPREVLFALDNDDPGQKAQERGVEIVKPLCGVRVLDDHVKAGVKDLHKLLVARKGAQRQSAAR